MKNYMIIGLTGTLASGKGVVSDYFKSKDFVYISLSDELRQVAKEKKIEITRENLQNLGNKLREESGGGVLAKMAINLIKSQKYKDVIIDGIRNPAEFEEFSKMKNFFLIAVDAPVKIRFERMVKRNRESDPMTFEKFILVDKKDFGVGEKNTGQGVGKCIKKAKFHLINDGSLEDVNKKIEELYNDIICKLPNISWDEYFMSIANVASLKSKDPSTKVGACIVDSRNRVVGLGFNGFPRYCNDNNFPLKREGDFLNTKYAYVVHAEANAIINSTVDTINCRIYVTLFPCNECAKLIIQSGIKEVIFASDKYSYTDQVKASKKMFKEAKINVRQFKLED